MVLGSFAWFVSRAPRRPDFGRIPVQLVTGQPAAPGSSIPASAPPVQVGAAGPAGAGVSALPNRRPAQTSPAAPSPGGIAAEASRPKWGEPGSVAQWWSGRSVVDYVAACRRGEAPRDSVLEPVKTPEQIALARTTDQLNELGWRMRGVWALEKFQQRLRESFPLMQ